MSIKKIAIIGLGSIGKRHLSILQKNYPNIEVIIVRSKKNHNDSKLKNHIVYSLEDALKLNIEAAIIASPAICHIKQGIILANHGIHLLIEKPLSHNLDQVNVLEKIIKKNNLICKVGYVLRHDPNLIAFKDFLINQDIGQILDISINASSYLPDWRPNQNYKNTVSAKQSLGGGALLELSHEIDYLIWLFGKPKALASIISKTNSLDIDVEDSIRVIMQTNNNYTISLLLNFCTHKISRFCEILTSKGILKMDLIHQNISWKEGKKEIKNIPNPYKRNYIYEKQLSKFLDAIKTNNTKENMLKSSKDVLHTIKKIYDSQCSVYT